MHIRGRLKEERASENERREGVERVAEDNVEREEERERRRMKEREEERRGK